MPRPSYLIVTGSSAGGLNALSELVSHLKPGMDAAMCIVLHLASVSLSDFLVVKLQPNTVFRVLLAMDGMEIEQGNIYIAPANTHLLVNDSQLHLGRGPEENRWRPSIDVLFRSAAAYWSNLATGIILTGLLNDGVAGMLAIKRAGGICIVQDPNEAEYPDMPIAVLAAMQPDHCLPLEKIGATLLQITSEPVPAKIPAPEEIIIEARIGANTAIGFEAVEQLGEKSQYACPDCGGGLYVVHQANTADRYRCHIGHAYSEKELLVKQNEQLENTLWVSLRVLQERLTLLRKLEKQNLEKGFKNVALTYYQKALELDVHIEKLKEVLFATQENKEVENVKKLRV